MHLIDYERLPKPNKVGLIVTLYCRDLLDSSSRLLPENNMYIMKKALRQSLVVLLAVEDAQNSEEEVDDVKVQADRSSNFLFDVVVAHDQLSVNQDISAEDQRRNDSVSELNHGVLGEESCHETEDDEHPETTEEVWHPAGEVILALAGKQRESDEDGGGEDESLQDDPALVERGDDTDRVCFQRSETAQEEEVGGVRLALPEGKEHKPDRAKERHPHHPLVCLDPILVPRAEEGNRGEGSCGEDLDGQDGVDFADEGHAYVEGRF